MDTEGELAPAVTAILESAREREGRGERVTVSEARSLPDALAAAERDGRVPLIAEVKPTSPTTDGERGDDPVELVREMVAGGAAALSVLTEPDHFGGSPDSLRRVREAVDVPVLRKDFLLSEGQLDVVESDVVLLIARFLGDDLAPMLTAARERGFQALVEVHTREELHTALEAGADIVGVNNRDLARLEVDLGTFERVIGSAREREAEGIPEDVTLIAESGIATPEDAARMRRAGADGLLVGSAIMDGDVRANTERLSTPLDPEEEGGGSADTDADADGGT
ncbi:indole-3-glycerol phosphate synthase [Salinirubellus sp. GCM10025818]|uniref:indole-3-glycerol phosphate synthase n=1 Tax=Salinirubellus TaxID=2162630 RepID=UPI0030D0D9DB